MKKITHRFISEVKRHRTKKWHDQKWWDFENLPETAAVESVLNCPAEFYEDLSDIKTIKKIAIKNLELFRDK